MSNIYKTSLVNGIEKRFGKLKKLPKSNSLFDFPHDRARIYIRYSRIHQGRNQSFYGLRNEDLKQLEGFNSFICFVWNAQKDPLFIPFSEFEEIFGELTPASDGQFKVQIFHQIDQNELYIANAGRFNIESFFGWNYLEEKIDTSRIQTIPDFSHSQIQTLIGSMGNIKGFDIWIPPYDRKKLDWNISARFHFVKDLPPRYEKVSGIIKEVDVIWIKRGSSKLQAMFEIEHSTPIYSGLLRFNDLHLIEPNIKTKFSVVSNEIKRALFLRQINRPTFKSSGLSELCNFMEYKDVFGWYNRINK